jgi:hypothetical protein
MLEQIRSCQLAAVVGGKTARESFEETAALLEAEIARLDELLARPNRKKTK